MKVPSVNVPVNLVPSDRYVRFDSYPNNESCVIDSFAVRLLEVGHVKGPVIVGEEKADITRVHIEGVPPIAVMGSIEWVAHTLWGSVAEVSLPVGR